MSKQRSKWKEGLFSQDDPITLLLKVRNINIRARLECLSWKSAGILFFVILISVIRVR